MLQPTQPYPIVKFSQSNQTEHKDFVVTEEPLEVWLSAHPSSAPELLFTTMRTPGDDLNLVKGWLFSSSVIQHSAQIAEIKHIGTGRLKSQSTNRVQVNLNDVVNFDVAAFKRVEVMNSACGVCGQQSIENLLEKLTLTSNNTEHAPFLNATAIDSLTQQLRDMQKHFAQTGGIHGVGLFDQQLQMLDVREDIGRHNAFDKLLGANLPKLMNKHHHNQLILGVVLSSRASFELIQKAAVAGIQYIIALGAPSSLAIDLAKDCDICLIGFVKSSHQVIEFNVYSSPHLLA